MGLAVVLLLLAVVFGGLSFMITALKWMLILAAVSLVAALVVGWTRRKVV